MSLFNACLNHRKVLTPTLLAAALAACGGGGSSSSLIPDNDVPFLEITEDNAGNLIYLALQPNTVLPLIQVIATNLGVLDSSDCTTGTITVTYDSSGFPSKAVADQCVLEDEDEALSITANGTVTYQLGSSDLLGVKLTALQLVLESEGDSIDTLLGGSFNYDLAAEETEERFTKVNLQVVAEGNSADKESIIHLNWMVRGMASTLSYPSEHLTVLNQDGAILLNGGSEQVSLLTFTPLEQNDDDDICFDAGELRMRGAKNSHIEVTFLNRDNITVDINGDAETFTSCAEFEQYMEELEQRFVTE